MSKITFFILFFFSFLLSAQEKNSRLIQKADSLALCGYFKEEIILRKEIVSLEESRKNEALLILQIAQLNQLKKEYKETESAKLYEQILGKYNQLPQESQNRVSYEINMLKAHAFIEKEQYEEGLSLFQKELSSTKKNSIAAGSIHLNIAQYFASVYNYYDAIKHFQKAIEIFTKNGMQHHYAMALAYNDLALAYDYANIEQEMLPTFDKALNIWRKYYSQDAEIVSVAYNDAIFAALEYGDREKCAAYQLGFEKYMADYIHPKNKNFYKTTTPFSDFHAKAMYRLNNLRYYNFEFNESKLLENLKEIEILFAQAPKVAKDKEWNVLMASYDEISHAFYVNYESERALAYTNTLEKLAREDFYRMKASANRAMLYYYKFEYSEALKHTEKSLNFLEILGYRSSYLTLLVLKAELLANLNKTEEAKAALKELYFRQFEKHIEFQKIKNKDFGDINNSSFINIFIHSGLAYRKIYESTGKKKTDLLKIRNFYGLAAEMFQNYYKKGFFNPDLERQLNNIKEGLLYVGLENPADQTFIAKSLSDIENMGSQHLWKQFISKYSENLNLPKTVINKRNELLLKLNFFENQEKLSDTEKAKVTTIQNEINQINQNINKDYPVYEKYSKANFDVNNLQKELKKDELVLKYSVTDSSVFVHKISSSAIQLVYLGKRKETEELVRKYYQHLNTINSAYLTESKKLHHLLMGKLKIQKSDKLIIIPEDFLSFLPFETLYGKEVLAQSNYVSYATSLKFLNPIEKATKKYAYSLVGFAPKYGTSVVPERSSNGELIYTAKELENISSIFNKSNLFFSEDATKTNFISSLGESNIHHLAMHSLLDEKDYSHSSLLFQNEEKLYFNEIYALNFPSDLVVLSACNTGVGKYLSGEGFMSISRALNYAGVKSTVYSLWQVPDKETSVLMGLFYDFLSKGHAKDEALSLAKRKFMEENPLKSHPYFWAGFVLNGDTSAISTKNNNWLIYGVIMLLLVAFAAFYLKKSRKTL